MPIDTERYSLKLGEKPDPAGTPAQYKSNREDHRMKMKRFIALLLAMMLAVGCLAGCAAQEKTVEEPQQTTETPAAEPEEVAEPEPQPEPEPEPEVEEPANKTITVSVQTGQGVEAGWKAVAEGYMALHPDVDVVIDLKPVDGYDQWVQNVFNTDDTTAVDIVNINLAGPAATNKAINFANYVDNDSPYSDGIWKDQFAYDKQVIAAGSGDFTSLSLESVQVLWLYNQDIFDEVGVEPPTTWSELIDVCEKVEAAGYQAIAMPGDFDSFYSGTMGWLAQVYADQTTRSMIEVTRSQPGDYTYDPDIDDYFVLDTTDPFNDDSTYVTNNPVRFFKAVYDGTYTAITPGMKTVWSNFAAVFPKYAGGDAMFGTKGEGAKTLFYQGKAAMYVDGGWFITGFANDMKALAAGEEISFSEEGGAVSDVKSFRLGSFNMPSMEGEGIEAKARTIEVAVGFLGCVLKDQAHNDLVVDFLMYYSSQQGMSEFVQAALENGWSTNGPSLVYGVQYPEEIQAAFDNLTMIGNVQKGYGQALARGFAEIPESYRAFYDYCYRYLTGAIDVDQFLVEHEQNIMDNFETGMVNTQIGYSDLDNPANEPTGE